jgi:hypothetical protein
MKRLALAALACAALAAPALPIRWRGMSRLT